VAGYATYNAFTNSAGGEVEEDNNNPITRSLQETTTCPTLETVSTGAAVGLFFGILYMFLALAIVCDEFFVSALEVIASEHYMNLSMDVAGATLMAAGGSAPELFTSFVGTFQRSDIGIGTIVGSAVFNVLFVIGVCSMLSKEVLQLTWWPLFRDCVYYATGLLVLAMLVGVSSKGVVSWWEALILFLMYFGYVIVMKYNKVLYKKLTGKDLMLGSEMSQGSDNFEENSPPPTVHENGDSREQNGDVEASSTPDADEVLSHDVEKMTHTADFRWPGTFRAGVLKLLLHPSSWEETGGIGIVAKIAGDVEQVFRTVDINGDGGIDKEELGKLFTKLGHEINSDDLETVFKSLDLDNNGTVSFVEFNSTLYVMHLCY
jgi:sodium/potassium/calcium exchanger 2